MICQVSYQVRLRELWFFWILFLSSSFFFYFQGRVELRSQSKCCHIFLSGCLGFVVNWCSIRLTANTDKVVIMEGKIGTTVDTKYFSRNYLLLINIYYNNYYLSQNWQSRFCSNDFLFQFLFEFKKTKTFTDISIILGAFYTNLLM